MKLNISSIKTPPTKHFYFFQSEEVTTMVSVSIHIIEAGKNLQSFLISLATAR